MPEPGRRRLRDRVCRTRESHAAQSTGRHRDPPPPGRGTAASVGSGAAGPHSCQGAVGTPGKEPESPWNQDSPHPVFLNARACHPLRETRLPLARPHTWARADPDLTAQSGPHRLLPPGREGCPTGKGDRTHRQASWAGARGRSCCSAQLRPRRRPWGPLGRPGCPGSRAWRPRPRRAWSAWPSSREPLPPQRAVAGKWGECPSAAQQALAQGAPRHTARGPGPEPPRAAHVGRVPLRERRRWPWLWAGQNRERTPHANLPAEREPP